MKEGRAQSGAELFGKLREDIDYVDVQFDEVTGALKATHILHNFDPHTGQYEKAARDVLFQSGHSVILLSERSKDIGKKTPDGLLNDLTFDIKTVLGSGKNNIKNKMNEARSQGCAHLVLFYPAQTIYDIGAIAEGYNKYLGVLRKDAKPDIIERIWIIRHDAIIIFK